MKSITTAAAAAFIVASTTLGFAQGMAPAKDPIQGSGSAADAEKLGDQTNSGMKNSTTQGSTMTKGSTTQGMSKEAPKDPIQGSGSASDAQNLGKATPAAK